MPPLNGIDRGLNGEALKMLEESGHGRRVAIVDPSYNIPRWAQKVDYRGQTSADALIGVVSLVPIEGKIIGMTPDAKDFVPNPSGKRPAYKLWLEAFKDAVSTINKNTDDDQEIESECVYRTDAAQETIRIHLDENVSDGFYSIANNEADDTLFIRTPDTLPYACATFVVGHSQTAE